MRFRISELRDMVSQILREDDAPTLSPADEKLRKWAKKGEDPIDAALAEIGIIPVPRGERDTSAFAFGASNDVREVAYKGRRCVARSSAKQSEFDAMMRFLAFKDKVPQEYRKHFPELYTTFELEVPEKIYGVVVEILEPLNPALASDLKHVTPHVARVPKSRVARALSPEMHEELYGAFYGKDLKLVKTLMDKVVLPMLKASHGSTPAAFETDLYKALVPMKPADLSERDYDRLLRTLTFHARQLLVQEVIPMSDDSGYNARKVKSHPHKKVHEFYDFLRLLSDRFGYKWDDMHTANFMVRPSTGDFVVVDPGLFYEYE